MAWSLVLALARKSAHAAGPLREDQTAVLDGASQEGRRLNADREVLRECQASSLSSGQRVVKVVVENTMALLEVHKYVCPG